MDSAIALLHSGNMFLLLKGISLIEEKDMNAI